MILEKKVSEILKLTKKTLCIAESCTGGLIANRLTNIPGSSQFLQAAIVAYSNDAKIKILKTDSALICKHGAVSEEVAMTLAQNAQKLFNTDFGLGVTGIAGPDGGSRAKPVGLVFIAAATKDETLCLKCQFQGTRQSIKKQAADQALKLLLEFLE